MQHIKLVWTLMKPIKGFFKCHHRAVGGWGGEGDTGGNDCQARLPRDYLQDTGPVPTNHPGAVVRAKEGRH